MTLEEAKRVFEIMASADGYCESCATSMMDSFVESFPRFSYQIVGDWYSGTAHIYLTKGTTTIAIPVES